MLLNTSSYFAMLEQKYLKSNVKMSQHNMSFKRKNKLNMQNDTKGEINKKFILKKSKFVKVFVKKFIKVDGNCEKIPTLFGVYYRLVFCNKILQICTSNVNFTFN